MSGYGYGSYGAGSGRDNGYNQDPYRSGGGQDQDYRGYNQNNQGNQGYNAGTGGYNTGYGSGGYQQQQPRAAPIPPMPHAAVVNSANVRVPTPPTSAPIYVDKDPDIVSLQEQIAASAARSKEIAQQYTDTVQKYHKTARIQEAEIAKLELEVDQYKKTIKSNEDELNKLRLTSDTGRYVTESEQKIQLAMKALAEAKRIGAIFERDVALEESGKAIESDELKRARQAHDAKVAVLKDLNAELNETLRPNQRTKLLVLNHCGSAEQTADLMGVRMEAELIASRKQARREVGTQEPEITDIDLDSD